MRRVLAALAVVTLLGGCSDGAPKPSASPAPLVERPLPSTAAAFAGELTLVADALERPGDDVRTQHDRLQACVRLARLREHAEKKHLASADRVADLKRAEARCPTDQAAAAVTVRSAARP